MSMTVPQGLMTAQHWTGVARTISRAAEQWAKLPHEPAPEVPAGIIAGAERFFRFVMDGFALERREPEAFTKPPMRGRSNLGIALAALPTSYSLFETGTLDAVEEQIKALRQTLDKLKRREKLVTVQECQAVTELATFFNRIYSRGAMERSQSFWRCARP